MPFPLRGRKRLMAVAMRFQLNDTRNPVLGVSRVYTGAELVRVGTGRLMVTAARRGRMRVQSPPFRRIMASVRRNSGEIMRNFHKKNFIKKLLFFLKKVLTYIYRNDNIYHAILLYGSAKMDVLNKRVQKTISYLNSERGKKNWLLNTDRGFSFYQNLFAAVQTATYLIKYEKIIEVYDAVNLIWEPAQAS